MLLIIGHLLRVVERVVLAAGHGWIRRLNLLVHLMINFYIVVRLILLTHRLRRRIVVAANWLLIQVSLLVEHLMRALAIHSLSYLLHVAIVFLLRLEMLLLTMLIEPALMILQSLRLANEAVLVSHMVLSLTLLNK